MTDIHRHRAVEYTSLAQRCADNKYVARDLLTVGPKFTRPAHNRQCASPAAARLCCYRALCCCRARCPWDRQTDGRTDTVPFTLTAYGLRKNRLMYVDAQRAKVGAF